MAEHQPAYDGLIGSELVRDDPSFTKIVDQFVDGLKDRLAKMEEAVRKADFESLRTAAHQLKGSGGGFGFPVLTESAAALEQHAKSHALDDCQSALTELRALCSRLVVDSDSPS